MSSETLIREKVEQAVGLLAEHDLDAWLTFVRETALTPDPCVDLIAGLYCVWESAFLIGRDGRRIAIVGRHDAPGVERLGAYDTVVPYDEGIGPALREALAALDPARLGVNTSESDPAADGLTHGMWNVLRRHLQGTPYGDRLVSAEGLVGALRGRKSPAEVALVRAAIAETEEILRGLTAHITPGRTELELAALVHEEVARRGLGLAWEPAMCPVVNNGPESEVGHAGPTELPVRRGELVHVDFGVSRDGYCADLQRMWYVLDAGEEEAPADVRRGFAAVWASLDAAAGALRPGARGFEVDAAARAALVAAGFPEPQHALGHQLGRAAHDGGTTLAPRWDRYGASPLGVIEAGNVFTLEFDVDVPGRGCVALEEDVLVTQDGVEWLSEPQRELWLIR